jgi:hypothetical protein
MTAIPIILGLLGDILTWAALANCSFLTATTNFSVAGIGFVKYVDPYLYTCQVWETEDQDAFFDGIWKFGKTMGFIAGVFGLVNFLLSTILCCMAFPRIVLQFMAFGYLFLGVFSILMLVGLYSEVCNNACMVLPYCTTCSMSIGPGARTSIAAFFLFAGAGIATLFLKEKEQTAPNAQEAKAKDEEEAALPESALAQGQVGTTVDVVEKLNDDGTKTVTSTTISPDGTKAIHSVIKSTVGTTVDVVEKLNDDGTKTVTTTTTNPDGTKAIHSVIESTA